jgi:hypothetical protein
LKRLVAGVSGYICDQCVTLRAAVVLAPEKYNSIAVLEWRVK